MIYTKININVFYVGIFFVFAIISIITGIKALLEICTGILAGFTFAILCNFINEIHVKNRKKKKLS